MAQLASLAVVIAMTATTQQPQAPTFADLCEYVWQGCPQKRPRFAHLTDREACQLAGAWMQENPLIAWEAVTETIYSDDLMTSIWAWLQAPTDERQAALLKLLRMSAVITVHDAIEAEFARIEESKLEAEKYG